MGYALGTGIHCLLSNYLDVQCQLPCDLAPGITLIHAEGKMLDEIAEMVKFAHAPAIHQYEACNIRKTPTNACGDPQFLPKDKWRYYLLRFDAPIDGIDLDAWDYPADEISLLSSLTRIRLEYFADLYEGGGASWSPQEIHKIDHHVIPDPPVFDESLAAEIRQLYACLSKIKREFPTLANSVRMYGDVLTLPPSRDFYVLGLFSVIESILTHNPKDKMSLDSLNRQIYNKFQFLTKRFGLQVDYAQFDGRNPKKIWNILYDWRSTIAHGGDPTEPVDAFVVANRGHLRIWLFNVTKALLKLALEDPQLMVSLREC